jgi:hypothetical protein
MDVLFWFVAYFPDAGIGFAPVPGNAIGESGEGPPCLGIQAVTIARAA